MSRGGLEPRRLAAATLALGGFLVALYPGHSARLLRIVIVAAAAGAALLVVHNRAARAWWTSPFTVGRRNRLSRRRSPELDAIAAKFGGRRQPVLPDAALPAETIRLLRPLAAAALERSRRGTTGADVSALTRALPDLEPQVWPRWFQTRSPDPRRVSELVHLVLDDLDRLDARSRHTDSVLPQGTQPP